MGASKKNSIQNGRAWCINQLFAAPPYFVDLWFLFFSEYEFRLHAWDLIPEKGHHFVRTCCSAISLRFSHSALNCLYRATHPFCKEIGLVLFIVAAFLVAMLTQSEAFCVFLHKDGCQHISPTKWCGAPCAPSAPPIVQFHSAGFKPDQPNGTKDTANTFAWPFLNRWSPLTFIFGAKTEQGCPSNKQYLLRPQNADIFTSGT